MSSQYIHLLRDPDVCGDKGQLICDHCKLEGGEDLEAWENFLNGEWLQKLPERPGTYPVVKVEGGGIELEKITKRNRVRRSGLYRYWSVPIPFDTMKGPDDA